ncbi:MAG: cytochrome c biogenesis protein CcsA [Bacteroidales bacterium]|nr:cytochrome c biogenesis protein CcsA [Bacteroidales bacterium]
MKHARFFLSVLIIALIAAMASGTVLERFHGPEYAIEHVYGSWWFVVLWALTALCIVMMLLRRKSWKRPTACALHFSVLLVLLGALLTMLTGEHGEMTLQPGVANNQFTIDKHGENREVPLPFALTLDHFEIQTYPGTHAPMDFVSYLQITDNGAVTDAKISMNHILKHRHYRFYQDDYDEQGNSVLAVAHDPWGVGFTYAGYMLLFISLLGLFLAPNGQFRRLLQKTSSKAVLLLAFITIGCAIPMQAANKPNTLPKESADKMGQMYVMYKGRVCPMQTLAKDFTTKMCGKARYQGLTPEQVFSGWLFYPEEWKIEMADVIKDDEEKLQLVNMLHSGQFLKMFPHSDSLQNITWYAQNDSLPANIADNESLFIRKQTLLCQEYVAKGDFDALNELFDKTKIYQEKYALGHVQPEPQYRAERLYNKLTVGRWLAIANITLGLICFALALYCVGRGHKLFKPVRIAATLWMTLLCTYLALLFILRWIAGGHIPMAGRFDSMNLLALSICIITLIMTRRYEMALPAGLLMTGFVLLVQMIFGANPPITHLMPVLLSPLLSLHVSVIMMAYALLFFIMLNGISAVLVRLSQPNNIVYLKRLQNISLIMLYPAVALLMAGIVIGAVWANISWGNYWSWDPKEVWALITLLIYAAPLHGSVWKSFRKPMFFHIYCILAFLSVVITYFGVSFLLGGMHSYA